MKYEKKGKVRLKKVRWLRELANKKILNDSKKFRD